MNYIFFDLEFNQNTINNCNKSIINNDIDNNDNMDIIIPHNNCDNTNNDTKISTTPKLTFEIIQIGALKLNENLEVIGSFNELVKPIIYKEVNPYVENLTKITAELLDECDIFIDIYNKFIDFVGNDNTILCVWGKSDIKEFIRNIRFHNLPLEGFPIKFIDVQKHTSKFFNLSKGIQIGLKSAVELLNINFKDNFHNAFYDAFYTCEVYRKIKDDSIKPEIYKHNSKKRINNTKEKVDINALLNQFSKMLNRDLSEEDKFIIKRAYNMGRTKQFIK